MTYITHHRFKETALCGDRINLSYGTELECTGETLVTSDGRSVCYCTSENAKRHFARNDDGKGLERGQLTYAIAYSSRNAGNGFRFSEDEANLLTRDWSHFLRTELDFILFNDDFIAADVEELQRLADKLKIKMRR